LEPRNGEPDLPISQRGEALLTEAQQRSRLMDIRSFPEKTTL